MPYEDDTLEGIAKFCRKEGQPHESLKRLLKGATETSGTCARCGAPLPAFSAHFCWGHGKTHPSISLRGGGSNHA